MGKILSVIRAKSSLECLPCDRVNLDYGNFGDYQDAGEHPAERPFEHPTAPRHNKLITFFVLVEGRSSSSHHETKQA